jgi:hydrogenase maturation protease
MKELLVIGVGNEFRGDDGAGLIAAQLIRDFALPGITILEQNGEGSALMAAWEGANDVIVIDAVQSGAVPGTIHRIEVSNQAVPAQLFNSFSSHAFGVAEAVEMARLLGKLPQRLLLWGIEGEQFEIGIGLSTAVAQAVDTAVQQIQQELTT